MKKAIIALLCLAFIVPIFLISIPVQAADDYLITIVEDTVLRDVSDNGMAVYIDGIIYVPYTTFKGINDITVNYNQEKQFVSVYRSGVMMYFELNTGLTYEYFSNRSVNVSAKIRNGVPYLPATILASWMNLYFSYLSESGVSYPVIRLCSKDPILSDSILLRTLSSELSVVAKARDKNSGINPSESTIAPPPMRTLAIMFTQQTQSTENQAADTSFISSFLDELSNYELPASFFFKEESLVPEAETLREIYARGFYPGILLTDSADPVNQAQRCSEIYAHVLHIRVRLVTSLHLELTDEQKTLLKDAGFLLWEPDHDPDTGNLSSKKLFSAIKSSLKNADEASVLHLNPNQITLENIPVLFSYLEAQNFTVVAMNDWTQPF